MAKSALHMMLLAGAAGLVSACTTAVAERTVGPQLDQNWSSRDRTRWYEASQGSRLLPLAWFKALEQPDSQAPLLSDDNVRRWGYLPYTASHKERLPVGFAVDRTPASRLSATALVWKSGQRPDEPWVGMNCSACHTAEIAYGPQTLRVDGGPALADFQTFLRELRLALVATRDQPDRFSRFAGRVLGPDDTPANRQQLQTALSQLAKREEGLDRLNAKEPDYGYGRLDAFGHIFNKVAYVVGAPNQTPNPSDAPVSYPFIWNIPQHDRVQWNGIVENKVLPGVQPFDLGALGRNTGEVIGVFADVQPVPGKLKGYRSSVDVPNLVAMEQQLGRLRPPAWPVEVFGWSPDHVALTQRGQALFQERCAGCHAPLARTDLKTPIKARMALFRGTGGPPPGTDPWMACNAYVRTAATGVLKGTPKGYFSGDPMGEEAFLSDMLRVTVSGVLFEQKGQVAATAGASFFGVKRPPVITPPTEAVVSPRDEQLARCMTEDSPVLGYKARPLTGIWATAPYLHNGSVPTLYDLLLPEAERPATFQVGSREFDPRKVGYRSDGGAGNRFLFTTRDPQGRPLPGNSNLGHDYGNATLSEADRWALVEYLKTL